MVIDEITNEKIAQIPTGSNISALCWNSTNNQVYCANYWGNNLSVIDGQINQAINPIPVVDAPCALAWNSIQN